MATTWDPQQYSRFDAERDRPAQDLMARLPTDIDAREIWDLGCGPGDHAARLAQRWPRARVFGLDSSPDMVATAQARHPGLSFKAADIALWRPDEPVDLIWSNAALHWLDDHDQLMPRLASFLNPGGVLAVQMPLGFGTPHHEALRAAADEGTWASALATVRRKPPLPAPATYFDVLAGAGCEADIWSTTYHHVLQGSDPVLEWMKGAALRPYLAALAEAPDLKVAFLADLAARLRQAYPPTPAGLTLLPFPRLFLLARRN